jgi:hypothetical protein
VKLIKINDNGGLLACSRFVAISFASAICFFSFTFSSYSKRVLKNALDRVLAEYSNKRVIIKNLV